MKPLLNKEEMLKYLEERASILMGDGDTPSDDALAKIELIEEIEAFIKNYN